jgi:hypothetical protein
MIPNCDCQRHGRKYAGGNVRQTSTRKAGTTPNCKKVHCDHKIGLVQADYMVTLLYTEDGAEFSSETSSMYLNFHTVPAFKIWKTWSEALCINYTKIQFGSVAVCIAWGTDVIMQVYWTEVTMQVL